MDLINSLTLNLFGTFAHAAAPITSSKGCTTGTHTTGILKGIPCDKPIKELKWIAHLINNAINSYLLPLAGTIFIIMIAIGGIQYITSAGNTQKAEAGKKTITFAIGGLLLIILAKVIVGIAVSFLGGEVV